MHHVILCADKPRRLGKHDTGARAWVMSSAISCQQEYPIRDTVETSIDRV